MMNSNATMWFFLVMMVLFTFTHALHDRKKSSVGMCRVAHEAQGVEAGGRRDPPHPIHALCRYAPERDSRKHDDHGKRSA